MINQLKHEWHGQINLDNLIELSVGNSSLSLIYKCRYQFLKKQLLSINLEIGHLHGTEVLTAYLRFSNSDDLEIPHSYYSQLAEIIGWVSGMSLNKNSLEFLDWNYDGNPQFYIHDKNAFSQMKALKRLLLKETENKSWPWIKQNNYFIIKLSS